MKDHPPQKHRHARSVFTLLEVMIAFALFAIGITSVVAMSVQASRIGQSARNRMEALHVARAELEEIKRARFDDPILEVGNHAVVRGGFSGQVLVSDRDPGFTKEVVVRLQYPSFHHAAHVELEGVISRALH